MTSPCQYSYAGGDPVNWVDPSGLYTEVIIWGRQGWDPAALQSVMGHVSVNINGVSYSLTPDDKNGMSIRPFDDYLTREQPSRVGHGVILGLTPEQEEALAAYLEGEPPDSYKKYANNCGAPVQWGLQELGVNLRDFAIRPNTLLEYLLESPYAIGETGYPLQR